MIRPFLIAVASTLLAASTSFAQPLADRIPAGAIVYAGWNGTDNPGKGYKGSHFKAVLEASELPLFLNEYLPKLSAKLAEKSPENAAVAKAMGAMCSAMWKHPSAIAIMDIKIVDDKPVPRMILISKAGNDAAAVKQEISALTPELQSSSIPVRLIAVDDIVALAIGFTPDELVLCGPADDNAYLHTPLSNDDGFKSTLEHLQPDPVAVGYINTDAFHKLIEKQLNRGVEVKDPATATKEAQDWIKFRDNFGIAGVHHVGFTSAFEGANCASEVFVDAPAPRSGFVALLDNGPVTNEFLKVIPKTAAVASAIRFDQSKLYVETRTLLDKLDPQARNSFDAAVAQVPTTVGFDVKPDLLDALGDQWAFYIDKNVGGTGITGGVIVNQARNADKLAETLGLIEKFASGAMAGNQNGDAKITLQQATVGDVTIHYVASPLIAPTWAIADGNLYLGLFPQTVVAAATHVSKKQPSIFENQAFIALQDATKTKKFTGMQFLDLPQTAPDNYGSILLVTRFFQGAMDMTGVISPPLVVPPMSAIAPHLTPAGSFSSADAAGLHLHCNTPFPGAELFAPNGFSTGPAMMGIILPALGKARQAAQAQHPPAE